MAQSTERFAPPTLTTTSVHRSLAVRSKVDMMPTSLCLCKARSALNVDLIFRIHELGIKRRKDFHCCVKIFGSSDTRDAAFVHDMLSAPRMALLKFLTGIIHGTRGSLRKGWPRPNPFRVADLCGPRRSGLVGRAS